MNTDKPLQFNGTAGGYFVLSLVTGFCAYIPFFGWAFLLNYAAEWLADNSLVNGRKVTYHADYGESLSFMFVNGLLLIITLGLYSIWFVPKVYRYIADHTSYADAVTGMAPQAAMPMQPPVNPVPPTNPIQ